MKHFLISFTVFFTMACASAASWQGRVFRVKDSQELSFPQFVDEVSQNTLIVLGENHSTIEVQNMQAQVIQAVVKKTESEGRFSLSWEFFSIKDQSSINENYDLLKTGRMSTESFIEKSVGGAFYKTYVPVIDAVKSLNGDLVAINLTREEKRPVTRGGIEAADPTLVPANYEIGGPNYFKRFKEQMQGHSNEDEIRRFFDAQCLTDDVMAFQTLKNLNPNKTFVIAGHFHTDYQDGMVHRLSVRAPTLNKVNVRIADASEYNESELLAMLTDPNYGKVADYVIFVKEPVNKN